MYGYRLNLLYIIKNQNSERAVHLEAEFRVIPIECKFGPTSAYAYYIDADEPALVDTGIAISASQEIEATLKEYGKSFEDLKLILLTHGHVDHLGGAHAVWEKTNRQAKVVIPKKEAYLLKDRNKHIDDYLALQGQFFDQEKQQQHINMLLSDIGNSIEDVIEVEEGSKIKLGNTTISVIETPGHSFGSVTFIIENLKWAFVADAVQIFGGVKSGVPTIEDPVAYRKTIKRLLDLRPARMYLGHHFRDAKGLITECFVEGEAVEDALQDSLLMDKKISSIIKRSNVSDYVNDLTLGKYGSFTPVAEALGYTGDPTFLPCAFLVTVNGYKNELHATGECI